MRTHAAHPWCTHVLFARCCHQNHSFCYQNLIFCYQNLAFCHQNTVHTGCTLPPNGRTLSSNGRAVLSNGRGVRPYVCVVHDGTQLVCVVCSPLGVYPPQLPHTVLTAVFYTMSVAGSEISVSAKRQKRSGEKPPDNPPPLPDGVILPEKYKASRCRFCMNWSTSTCPFQLMGTLLSSWDPFLPWARGKRDKPIGEVCKLCRIAIRIN